jgi:hypothetical protein
MSHLFLSLLAVLIEETVIAKSSFASSIRDSRLSDFTISAGRQRGSSLPLKCLNVTVDSQSRQQFAPWATIQLIE